MMTRPDILSGASRGECTHSHGRGSALYFLLVMSKFFVVTSLIELTLFGLLVQEEMIGVTAGLQL